MHQSGIENVVASSGTSLTTEQIRLIKRFTSNITVIYDGDQAGIKASLRGIDMILEEDINVKVVPLPQGEDPDSFARSMNASSLLKYIAENETYFISFKTNLLLGETEHDPMAKARLIGDIVKSIAVIPGSIQRTVYIKECSKLLDVDEEILYSEVRKIKFKQSDEETRKAYFEAQRAANKPKPVEAPVSVKKNPCEVEEMALLRILIRYCNHDLFSIENETTRKTEVVKVSQYIMGELENDGLASYDPVMRTIFEEFQAHYEEEYFNPERYFVQHENPQVSALISGLLVDKHTESMIWKRKGAYVEDEDEILYVLVPRLVEEYKLRHVMLIKEIGTLKGDNDLEKIMELQTTITNLKLVEKDLSKKLGKRAVNI
jgi:DNA primase